MGRIFLRGVNMRNQYESSIWKFNMEDQYESSI